MSPRTPKQFEEIRKSKKELIKQTAKKLFAENGYHKTSIAQIAKETSISKGLLYNYFDNKEQLLVEIMKEIFDYFSLTVFSDDGEAQNYSKTAFFKFIDHFFDELTKHKDDLIFYYTIYFQKEVKEIVDKYEPVIYEKIYKILIKYFQNMKCQNPDEELLFFNTILEGSALDYACMTDFPIEVIKKKIIEYYKTKF